jgi:hypothetical protein
MFKLYPEIFPEAYFRFLKANLDHSLQEGSYIYAKNKGRANSVLITWKQYKKAQTFAEPGDYILEKMVTLKQGDGLAQEAMDRFLKIVQNHTCFLKVAKHNKRAISFYEKNGFKVIDEISFGSIPGLLMKRN